ncbi:MAG TPA: DUF3592 domain-containing protein [Tepidisphaeraceae bacterium]|nr:DUF3592 domain-containing protein [Tepidisphaeraceae bacterium]
MPRQPVSPFLYHPTPWRSFFSFPNWLFLLFIPIGLILFYFLFLIPTQNVLHARSWLPTPCTILSSTIHTHHDSKSTTYSPEIRYQYQFNHHPYTGARFNFIPDFSTSSYNSVANDLKPFRPRTQTTCYVNPADPADSVLLRNFTPTFFLGLTPLLFTLAGAAGLLAQLLTFLHVHHPISTELSTPRRLHSNHQPFSNFFAFFLATLMLAGTFSVFFSDCLASWQNHFPNIPLTVALFPFALFVLVFTIATLSLFISLLRSPHVVLNLSADPLTPNIPATLRWRLRSPFSLRRVKRLRIDLVGFIDTATSPTAEFFKSPFIRISLLDTTDPAQFPAGSLPFTPPTGPPSFFLPYNRIRWTFNLLADLAHADPLDLSFSAHLAPPPPLPSSPAGSPLNSTTGPLTLSLPHSTYPPGSALTVTASSPSHSSTSLTLLLYTTGRGIRESHILSRQTLSSASAIHLPLPQYLPPSYTNDLLSIHYALELRLSPTLSTLLEFQVL